MATEKSKTDKVLSGIQSTGGILSIALPVAGQVVELVTGVVQFVKSEIKKNGIVEYTIVIAQDEVELSQIDQISDDDLALVNTELTKLGMKPLPTE